MEKESEKRIAEIEGTVPHNLVCLKVGLLS